MQINKLYHIAADKKKIKAKIIKQWQNETFVIEFSLPILWLFKLQIQIFDEALMRYFCVSYILKAVENWMVTFEMTLLGAFKDKVIRKVKKATIFISWRLHFESIDGIGKQQRSLYSLNEVRENWEYEKRFQRKSVYLW